MLPALCIYGLFLAYPLISSIRLSFYTGEGLTPDTFAGLANYRELFSASRIHDLFVNALGNTTVFFLIHMLVQNVAGLLFAELLSDHFRGRNAFRAVIFIPATMSIIITGFLWRLLLNPQWGAVNGFLEAVGLDNLTNAWMGDPSTALPAMSLVSAWQFTGVPTIIFLAGLLNIPEELTEAAALDGASRWRIFFKIRLPLLKPVIGIVTILTFVANFTAFDIVFSMAGSRGEPQFSTDLLATLFFRTGIAGDIPVFIPAGGMGAAIATLTFVILAVGSFLWFALTRSDRRVEL